jgi:hypothetical protein
MTGHHQVGLVTEKKEQEVSQGIAKAKNLSPYHVKRGKVHMKVHTFWLGPSCGKTTSSLFAPSFPFISMTEHTYFKQLSISIRLFCLCPFCIITLS